jgi:hypothetical protein
MLNILNTGMEPISEHDGTVTSWFMYPKESLRAATEGSYLEFVNEFQLDPGVSIQPHLHNSHEFYYVLHASRRGGTPDGRGGDGPHRTERGAFAAGW